jgi:hypothetical protein
MPTLLIIEGFRSYFFHFFSLEENEAPHVHVRKGGGKAKFWLSPVHSRHLNRQELRRAHELTEEHAEELLKRWQEYFDRRSPARHAGGLRG